MLNAVDEFCLCYFFLPKKLLCYKIRLKFYLLNCTTWPCNLSLSQNLSKQNIFFGVSYFPLFFLLSLLKNDMLYLNIYVRDKKTFRWWGTRYGCILYLRMSAHSQCFNVKLRQKLATPLRTLMHRSSCLLHQSDFKIFLVFDRRLRWKWSAVKGARGWRTDYGINDNLVI